MDKHAVITGASSGIGRALAIELSANGYRLTLVARRKEKLDELAKELRTSVDIVSLDLTDRAALEHWALSLTAPIDLLINNAGFGDAGPFLEANWKKLESMLELNVLSLTRLCHLVGPKMVTQGHGSIVNVASTAAFMPGPLMATYFASKAYVLHFTEALANELAPAGIHVMALCPGATRTEFFDRAGETTLGAQEKRLPTATDVARFTLESLKSKRIVAVHGLRNRLMVFLTRLTPRTFTTKIIRKFLER